VGLNYLDHIEIDPELYRPSEVELLKGDSSKAKRILNWEPKISFDKLIEDMVTSDIEIAKYE
jgi:GDPmannose 4,6-dehydratase